MPGPTGNVRDNGDFDFKAFVMDIPPVTRTAVMTMFTCTLLAGLKIIPIQLFVLDWHTIVTRFQPWRAILTFCHLGRLGLSFLIRMYFFFTYSKQLEIGVFFGRPANYAWFLTFVCAFVLALTPLIPSPINGGALLIAIIHLWGRHATNVTVSLYGFIQIPAKYFSLAMLFLDVVISGGVAMSDILGLLGGHLYYFLDSVYPAMPDGKHLIFVPLWFERLIDQLQASLASVTGLHSGPPPQTDYRAPGVVSSRSTATANGPQNRGAAASGLRAGLTTPTSRGGSHTWGSGQTLGST